LGRIIQEIAEEIGQDFCPASLVFSQIDDDGMGVGEELHCRNKQILGFRRGIETPDIQVADLTVDPLQLEKARIFLVPQKKQANGMVEGALGFIAYSARSDQP